MSKLSLCEIQQSQLDKTPIVDGQLVCCLDTGNTYRDTAGGRVRIGSDLERVSELPLAPLAGKIYYLPPGDLYIYNSGWVMLNDTDFTIGVSKADATEANLELKHGDMAKGTVKVRGTGITSVTADADGRLIINTPNPKVVNNLTSDSTTDSLSAAQGKALKALVDGKAAMGHTHNSIKDIGNMSSDITFSYSKAGMSYTDYAWLAGWNGYELRAVNKDQFATAGHTHTKAQVGLDNVDNTADANKSVKYATKAANADVAIGVADYNTPSKTIKIGYNGDGITGDAIKYIAGYTTGDGGSTDAKIKDVSKGALQSWLGLGSAAYTASSAYAASNHTHDDRYYTESEINTKLAGKADSGHIHLQGTESGKVDWNTLKTFGVYKIQSCTMTADYHAPVDEYAFGILQVLDSENGGSENRIIQIYWPHRTSQGAHLWYRMHNSSNMSDGWSNWTAITEKPATAGVADSASSVAWVNVTGKPSTFTPSSHTHNYAGSSSAGGAATSANKVNAALTINLNGTSQGAWDGSSAKSISITAASVGATSVTISRW